MNNVKKFAIDNKWVVIMLVESRNGPSGPCIGNFLAAHDDAVKRLRIIDDFKVITGLSGAARESSAHCGMREGFAGVILQGAGFGYYMEGSRRGHYILESVKKTKTIMVYGIFGDKDDNKVEIERMKSVLPKHTVQKFFTFNGGHTWAPEENMSEGLKWIENYHLKSAKNKQLVKCMVLHKVVSRGEGDSKLDQYESCMGCLMLLKESGLLMDADAKKVISSLLAEKKQLESDPEMKKEILAFKDFKKAQAAEEKFRKEASSRKMSTMFLKAKIQNCVKYYQKVDAMHPGTESSSRAQERISALENEM